MNQLTTLRRLSALVATAVIAILAFAGGLFLMNIRDDWALALGALVCIATPVLAGVRLWSLLSGDTRRTSTLIDWRD